MHYYERPYDANRSCLLKYPRTRSDSDSHGDRTKQLGF